MLRASESVRKKREEILRDRANSNAGDEETGKRLIEADPELVLVVHRPPADDGPLREHLSQCRIDALAAGQRAVLDRILKARSHHGRVVRHGDIERLVGERQAARVALYVGLVA